MVIKNENWCHNRNEWKRHHKRAYRHLDYYIGKILENYDADWITEGDLQNMLHEETGFRFKKQTIYKYLKRIEAKYMELPLETVYRVNRSWFECHNPKKPRAYSKKAI
jgi:hypothetical protein